MVVFVLLVEQTEAFIIDHARLCEATHVSHGFRRDTFQKEAIHYCYPTNITNGKCEALGKLKEICLFYHKPYYMMSMGLPGYPWYYLYISLSLSLSCLNSLICSLKKLYIPVLFSIVLHTSVICVCMYTLRKHYLSNLYNSEYFCRLYFISYTI